jgi:phosphopantothenoylcysteine decarboxylase/phosphopantothenate--cysteine ligase
MFAHPAIRSSVEKLSSWGALILPTGEGRLACGALGKGRLIEPAEALDFIHKALTKEAL